MTNKYLYKIIFATQQFQIITHLSFQIKPLAAINLQFDYLQAIIQNSPEFHDCRHCKNYATYQIKITIIVKLKMNYK